MDRTVDQIASGETGAAGAAPPFAQSILLGISGPELRFQVHAQRLTPYAGAELHEIEYVAPQTLDSVTDQGFIDLALSRRRGDPLGVFPEVRGHGPRPIGDMLFVPAGTRLQTTWRGSPQRSVCIKFAQENRLQREWSPGELDAALDLRDGLLRETMVRLADELEHPGFESTLMIETLCVQVAIILRRHFDLVHDGEAGHRLGSAHLRRVEDLLDQSGPAPTLGQLSSECGLSPRHFCRLFRAATGRSLGEYAMARRVERAKALLADGRTPIKQIAWSCGFTTPAAFSAAFRRATGFQPSRFRNARLN